MSVITKANYIYSERKNNVYRQGDVIDFYIPPSNAILNTQDTYLVFNIKLTGQQYKACVSQRAGIYSLFRAVTISAGDGSSVLETLDHYGYLQALKYRYESTESGDNLRYLHEGLPNKAHIDDTSCNQYCNAQTNSGAPHKMVEVTAPLYLSGCLSPLRQDVFPCVATRGLRVKLELNTADTVLQAVQAPLYELSDGENKPTGANGGYEEDAGYAIQAAVAANGDEVTLKNASDLLGADVTAVLSPNSAAPTHLFNVDQWVYVKDANGDDQERQITTIEIDGNRVKLTLSSAIVAGADVDAPVWINTDSSRDDMDFELSEVRMNVGNVETPGGYLDAIISKVKSGKMNFDIFSYTDYPRNISSNSLNNTLPLNCRNQRAKALLSIPQGSTAHSVATDSFEPAMNEPRSYNYLLYNNILVPDRTVKLQRLVDGNYDAVALREQMLALHASGWEVNNVRNSAEHFFLGRRLALPGYSYDTLGAVTLNVNYSKVSALMMHNFLMHKRQIKVKDDGIAVSY